MTTAAPFFILGNPRSGTSLLRSLLNTHPDVLIPRECGFMHWLHADWQDRTWDAQTMAGFAQAVQATRKFETWDLDVRQVEEALIESGAACYAQACSAIYELYARSRNKAIICWGDKNNHYITEAKLLKTLFPAARFIHIVRDPRDMACSYLELHRRKQNDSPYWPALSPHVGEIAEEWLRNNQAVAGPCRESTLVTVKYEDLVEEPKQQLDRIFAGLQLPPLEELSEAARIQAVDEPVEFTPWKSKVSSPINASAIGRYRNELSPEEVRTVESRTSPLLEQYGYA